MLNDESEVKFILNYSDDFTVISITCSCTDGISPEEFFQCLAHLYNEYAENADEFFSTYEADRITYC